MNAERPDFVVCRAGAVATVTAHSRRAQLWLREHLPVQVTGGSTEFTLDSRWAAALTAAAEQVGLLVRTRGSSSPRESRVH